ncbi:MAG: undecaprenyl-diphosphate phosphatase [Bacteroidales bacterium]|nr:undecaprenyl-diphosphate phosphatase [Bacteroidales bacterium]
MDWFDALIMGIVQGLAEYLPISSSGHLEILHDLLGLQTDGADSLQFDVILHIATVLSTIVVLWHEFSRLCKSFFTMRRDQNTLLVWKILVSCIPVLFVGVFLKDRIEALFGGQLLVVGVCLCITAALLAFAYFTRTKPIWLNRRTVVSGETGRNISFMDAFIIGCAQAVAVLPGLSRSGSTIATGILLGNKRDRLASFSFLMVIIPVLGAALLDIYAACTGKKEPGNIGVLPCIVGFIASFLVGCVACKWMINLVKKGGLVWFSLYCIVVGIICIIFA